MNDRPAMPKEDPWQDTRYTGNAQHFPRHELEGESQATVGEWSDALLAKGRDILTDGTLSATDPATTQIVLWVQAHRKGQSLIRETNKRMASFRRDQTRKPDTFNLTDFERHQVEQQAAGEQSKEAEHSHGVA